MPTIEGRSLDFEEAGEFLRQKVDLPTRAWTDMWEGQHARAFVVAGAMRDELVADFHEAVRKGIDAGTTLAEFRKDFDRIVARHGWSYRGGRNWRSRVIFETNMRTAYQAGRWEQIQRLKDRRPFLRYVAVLDERTRPDHRAWHGTVLPADDAWWSTHYPPNGWNCRCTVQQLSQRDMERFGYSPSESAPPVEMETRSVNTPEGPVAVQAPKGIDTGWGYNVGEAHVGRGVGPHRLALERHGGFKRLEAPGGSRPANPGPLVAEATGARPGPPATDEASMRAAFRRALGGDSAILTDPTGARVEIGEALVAHQLGRADRRERFWPFMRDLVEAPHEIWVGFARDKVTGRVSIRRRYVKQLRMRTERPIVLVADVEKGLWQALTSLPEQDKNLEARVRWGLRIYRKGE
jgi:SPP1 gp7 family putative phage head morphogenesis protein